MSDIPDGAGKPRLDFGWRWIERAKGAVVWEFADPSLSIRALKLGLIDHLVTVPRRETDELSYLINHLSSSFRSALPSG